MRDFRIMDYSEAVTRRSYYNYFEHESDLFTDKVNHHTPGIDCERIDHCKAWIYTEHHDGKEESEYTVRWLKSYNTLVALAIEDENGILMFDILRLVYGYTQTSAKHIARFRHRLEAIGRRTGKPVDIIRFE